MSKLQIAIIYSRGLYTNPITVCSSAAKRPSYTLSLQNLSISEIGLTFWISKMYDVFFETQQDALLVLKEVSKTNFVDFDSPLENYGHSQKYKITTFP